MIELIARIRRAKNFWGDDKPRVPLSKAKTLPFPPDYQALLAAGYGSLHAGIDDIKVIPLRLVLKEHSGRYCQAASAGLVVLTIDCSGNGIAWDTRDSRLVLLDHGLHCSLEPSGDGGWVDEDGDAVDIRARARPIPHATFVDRLRAALDTEGV